MKERERAAEGKGMRANVIALHNAQLHTLTHPHPPLAYGIRNLKLDVFAIRSCANALSCYPICMANHGITFSGSLNVLNAHTHTHTNHDD